MDSTEEITRIFEGLIQEFANIHGGLQIVIAIGCALLAFSTNKRWRDTFIKLFGDDENNRLLQTAIALSERVIFPLSMLLYTIAARFLLHQFGYGVVILDIVVPLLLSFVIIRISVYTLESLFTPGPILRAWESIFSYTIWTVVALHLVGWLDKVIEAMNNIGFRSGDSYFSILSLFNLLIVVVLFMLAAHWISGIIEKRAKKSAHLSASMRVGLSKISKFTLYALAVLFALQSVGIDVTTFAVVGGAIGVGLGFGLQKIFSNFISGFILLFDRSIKPGDVISIGDRFGVVEGLRARYIVVRDRDGVETLIPNENLITSEVTNWSYTDKIVRVKLPVQISYHNDPEFAMSLLTKACEDEERILPEPFPVARLMGFGDSGVDLELRVWVDDPEIGVGNVKSDLYVKIWRLFKENDITIPFPQREVRILNEENPISEKA